MIFTPSSVTNCHTFLDPSHLDHDILYGLLHTTTPTYICTYVLVKKDNVQKSNQINIRLIGKIPQLTQTQMYACIFVRARMHECNM